MSSHAENDAAVDVQPGMIAMCGPVELVMLCRCPENWGDQRENGPVWMVHEPGCCSPEEVTSFYVRTLKPTRRRVQARTLEKHLEKVYKHYPELRPLEAQP
jgi:hypothetical protein